MGILGFLKKKEELPLPPPPVPPALPPSDIPEIRPQEIIEPTPAPIEAPQISENLSIPVEMPQEIAEPTIERVEPEEEIKTEPPPQSIFISIDDYKTIINHTNIIQSRIAEAQTVLKNLEELNAQEEKERQRWQTHVEQLEKKFAYIDKILANG